MLTFLRSLDKGVYSLQNKNILEVIITTKDFRDLDEREFEQMFYDLKRKTSNFQEVSPELIIENNKYLLILRICLGLSQKEFASKLGATKDWCRHLESGKNYIVSRKVACRYTEKLTHFIQDSTINLEKVLNAWKTYKFNSKNQILQEPKVELKQISKLDESDLIEYVELIKKETNNFNEFNHKILEEIPQSILIFRIILGIDHRRFSKLIDINDRSLRKYESLNQKIKPATAEKIINKISDLFKKYKSDIDYKDILENFRILKGLYGHRNLESYMNNGLKFAEKQPLSEMEKEICKILEFNRIDFKTHSIIDGYKRKLNVDFLIQNENNKIVIECTSFEMKSKFSQKRRVICNMDHRFQMLKMKDPNIETIMAIGITGKPVFMENVKKLIESELLNTDYLLIKEELEKLPEIIKNTEN